MYDNDRKKGNQFINLCECKQYFQYIDSENKIGQ